MKRILSFLIVLVFVIAIFLSGCGKVDRTNELKQMMEANESSLNDTFSEETCEYDLFSDYITSWAKGSDITVAYTGKSSTVLQNKATEKSKKEPSTVLYCELNTADVQSSLKCVSLAMTCLMGPNEHGDITLVIGEYSKGKYKGIKEVPVKYFTGDNFINLQNSSSDTILISGPNSAACEFYKSGNKKDTIYNHAFEITMSMAKYSDPFNFVSEYNYPNPINTIGSLLATIKSSGKLFDIASFSSKSKDGCTPYYAKAIVVTEDNSVDSFTKRFEKSYENVEDKFGKIDDSFVYTINETDIPKKVLDDEVSNNLISLMYTLNTGICSQDDESGIVYAASYIESISTNNGDLDLHINIRSRGLSYLDILSTEYETTAGLCSTKYSCDKFGRVWTSDTKSNMVEFFTQRAPLQESTESNVSIRTYENDFIAKKLPKENMIIYTFESGNRKTVMTNIVEFMDPKIKE